MGTDIHIKAQKRNITGAWEDVYGAFHEGSAPFDWRSYSMFGFLADVRNYSAVTPISEQRGLPSDYVRQGYDMFEGLHSISWLGVDELLSFDYEEEMEDRRVTRQTGPRTWDGGVTADPGDGEKMTYRQFLGQAFFDDLDELRRIGAERIVFGFDS